MPADQMFQARRASTIETPKACDFKTRLPQRDYRAEALESQLPFT